LSPYLKAPFAAFIKTIEKEENQMPESDNKSKKELITVSFQLNVNLISALGVGMTTGILFHPADRALYLRGLDPLKNRQSLLSPYYWSHPFSGLRNTFYQRILSNGTYFYMQGELNTHLYPLLKNEWQWSGALTSFTIGALYNDPRNLDHSF
jgi:hypothetical protein